MTMVDLHHKNLVNIYGVCTREEPVLIVSELCEKGSLKDFLPHPSARDALFSQFRADFHRLLLVHSGRSRYHPV